MKRVVIATIAILGTIGLVGCVPEYKVSYEDLEERCELLEEALSDIIWHVDEARSALDDLCEAPTSAWVLLTGQEEVTDALIYDAVNDIENSWRDENKLRDLLHEIENIAEDAKYSDW